jgi:calcineurin-like phosphoesterase family protein
MEKNILLNFKDDKRKVLELKLDKDPFVISDFHLNHKNIIEYTNRPFKTIDEMNEAIIKNWNLVVKEDDLIIFVGDFCLGHKKEFEKYLLMLKGKIVFVKGNHDSKKIDSLKELIIVFKKQRFFVTHKPINKPINWKEWIIHGHCHNNNIEDYPFINKKNKTINVSCELLNYWPIKLSTIIKRINN